jgi:UDP-GlcNAc:undecaprenyl-phosphate GlcNAc-1-phosphate transferase
MPNANTATGLVAFLTAFGASACLTPVVRHFARRRSLYDHAGELTIHVGAVPRIGGVAIAIAFVTALVASRQLVNPQIRFFLGAVGLVWLVGLVDDLRDLPPSIRLLAQAISAILLYCGGWRVEISTYPVINLITTIVLVMWFVNSMNFVDGMDGLAAGITAVAAIAFAILFATQGVYLSVVLAIALLGCCVGFLLFNFPPASIFMGDCGSTMLGVVLGALTLAFFRSHSGTSLEIGVPLLFAALPLADAAFAVIRRLRQRKSPFAGDRRHFYDLLLHRGWSGREVVLVSYFASALFALAGLLDEISHLTVLLLILAGTAVVVLGALLGSLQPGRRLHDSAEPTLPVQQLPKRT